jgi:molybdate transport system regulatory protein
MNLIIKGALTIETDSGEKINPRIIELLRIIEQTGSLNEAVKELEMSYSYAWNTIFKLNCQLPHPLVVLQRGGKGGGVATLTESGKRLLAQYELLKKDFIRFMKEHPVIM